LRWHGRDGRRELGLGSWSVFVSDESWLLCASESERRSEGGRCGECRSFTPDRALSLPMSLSRISFWPSFAFPVSQCPSSVGPPRPLSTCQRPADIRHYYHSSHCATTSRRAPRINYANTITNLRYHGERHGSARPAEREQGRHDMDWEVHGHAHVPNRPQGPAL
jgi:hypothetical protein